MELQRWSLDSAEPARWCAPFPARWWRGALPVDDVRVEVTGGIPFVVIGHNSDGRQEVLFESLGTGEVPAISVRSHEWITVETPDGSDPEEIRWLADFEVKLPGVVAVVPTFRREADATQQSATFLGSELVARVIVIDQGGTLKDHLPFGELRRAHPERLRFVEQPNLGGSGGYARGMIESLADPDCAVLLSDDDAALPDESLRRMLLLQALATTRGRKLVMATPMFSAEDPTRLISAAEWVDPSPFQWGAADGLREPLDISLGTDRLLHALDIHNVPNYAGWWGSLLPPAMVREVGLPAPYFLKWDDAEYGLRATRRGYEFMALPGTGVWHPTWGAHKTLTTWVAVLLHRNRLATAAAYGSGRGVIWDSFMHQVKHVLSLQYGVADLWAAGIVQFLEGPEWLGMDLPDARNRAQAAVDRLPKMAPRGDVPARRARLSSVKGSLRSLTGLLRRAGGGAETSCIGSDFTWRDGLGMDRVVITDEVGVPRTELVRDARRARSALGRAATQHWTLARRWRELSPRYAEMLERSTALGSWRETLGIRV